MRLFNSLVITFYTLLVLLLGAVFVSVSLGIITIENITEMTSLFYGDTSLRLSLLVSGLLLIIISLGVVQLTANKVQREKTIAFENADGQVSISLSAIEDFIKRVFRANVDIKELKPVCTAGRKGIDIQNRVTLWEDAKIPEVTEKIQSTIKERIQQILGIEESITVRVHVVKILPKEVAKPKKQKQEEVSDAEAPYQYKD